MGCGSSSSGKQSKSRTGFCPIPDRFTTCHQVTQAIRGAGLENSQLIVGVDFTKSNLWTGKKSFAGRSLHHISCSQQNPYQSVLSILGRTLEDFDDDKQIPAFGFGDKRTGDHACFSFNDGNRPCSGIDEVLSRYNELAQCVTLSGPTCFAPVIREAIRTVQAERSYHILVIVADGQVTDASASGETAQAIIEASHYPLSIICIGVGDGPWDIMETYDDELPSRQFDNFQFVNFTEVIRQQHMSEEHLEARFALAALMEIPDQYAFIKSAGLLRASNFVQRPVHGSSLLPPPTFMYTERASHRPSPSKAQRRSSGNMPPVPPGPPPPYTVHAWAAPPAME